MSAKMGINGGNSASLKKCITLIAFYVNNNLSLSIIMYAEFGVIYCRLL